MKVLLSIVVTGLIGAACAESTAVCAGVGLARTDPSDTTIAVGSSFIARHHVGGMCVGDESSRHLELVAITSWYSPDTAIVHVDAATGRVTGRAIGDARLRAVQHGIEVPIRVR